MALFRRRDKTRSLVASAAGQPIGDRETAEKLRRRRRAWANDAWVYYDSIGEIRYALEFVANAITRMRIYPAIIDNPDEPPVALDQADGVPPSLLAAAQEDLAALGTGQLGLRPILHDQYVNNKVAGEMWLVGAEDDAGIETWRIRSMDELMIDDRGQMWVRDDPLDRQLDWIPLPAETSYVSRMWRPHPRFEAIATSPMHAILESCEELLLLSRSIRATARSRLAGNGLLILAQELSLDGVDKGDDPEADPFFEELTKAMLTPIGEEGDASAVVPIVARVPGEFMKEHKVAELVRFDRPFDAESMKLRDELLGRIATGLDLPREIITGVADLNHWSAWQVDDSTFRHHIEPDVISQVDDLSEAYMRPRLRARGEWDAGLLSRVCYWYDPTELVTHPDRTQDAMSLHDKIVISDAALAKAAGFGDDDLPDPQEKILRMFQHARTFPPNVVEAIIHRIDPSLVIPADKTEPGEGPDGPTPPDGTTPTLPPAPGAGGPTGPPPASGPPPPTAPATTAAGTPTPLSPDDREPSGVMVAFYPTAEQAAQVAMADGEAPDAIHVTLAYLGHVEDLTDGQVQQIHDVASQAAASCAPLEGEFGGIGRFTADGSPDGDPVIATVDVPGLGSFRDQLCQAMASVDLPLSSDHGFTPHATLAYIDPDADMPAHRLDPVPASFAALSVVVGADRTDYPLTGADVPLVAAAAARTVHAHPSRQLVDIDRQLRARLLAACDATVRRQLERAGARLRSKAAKDPALRASLAAVPQHLVAATLGVEKVLALGVTDADLLNVDFSDLHAQWNAWVAAAQRKARKTAAKIVGVDASDPQVADLEATQAQALDAGWSTLAGGMTSLVAGRLYDPAPDAPPVGEHDTTMTVPPGLVRQAIAVAGADPAVTDVGGQATLTLPPSAMGIGSGGAILDFLQSNGAERDHYIWRHGDVTRPLPEHEDLDGYEFTDWDDDGLVNQGSFPEVEVLAPGDHDGCSCDAEVVWATQAADIAA